MKAWLNSMISRSAGRFREVRNRRRIEHLRALGMQIGADVLIPPSTRIDVSHCFMIHIGDHCGFGQDCVILAHDAQMDEFLDVTRIGRVTIHESCHIGTRVVILPGVEIGPRTIVGAGSVVSRDLPADSVCMGTPARRICSLDEYLQKHRRRAGMRPTFDYFHFDIGAITPERRKRMYEAAADGVVYMTGGRTAQLDGTGAAPRTAEPVREPIRGRAARQPT